MTGAAGPQHQALTSWRRDRYDAHHEGGAATIGSGSAGRAGRARHLPECRFCVIRVKARGHRDLVTVVGHAAVISAGEWITAAGDWTNDRTHGQQFKARFLKTSAPASVEGIEKYLAEEKLVAACGIGQKQSHRTS
jgi:hypothetical protein